jgi:hypothetical protein
MHATGWGNMLAVRILKPLGVRLASTGPAMRATAWRRDKRRSMRSSATRHPLSGSQPGQSPRGGERSARLPIHAVLLGGFLLAGCVPAAITYHHPVAVGGVTRSYDCSTIVGPRETIRFRYGEVELRVSGTDEQVQVGLLVPEGHTVVRPDRRAHVERGGIVAERELSELRVPALRYHVTVLEADTVVGATERLLFARLPRTALSWVDVSGPPSPEYVLRLPPLLVDGRHVEPPPIHFRRRRSLGLFLLNC